MQLAVADTLILKAVLEDLGGKVTPLLYPAPIVQWTHLNRFLNLTGGKYTSYLCGCLVGLVVKASSSGAKNPEFDSGLQGGVFLGWVIPVS